MLDKQKASQCLKIYPADAKKSTHEIVDCNQINDILIEILRFKL